MNKTTQVFLEILEELNTNEEKRNAFFAEVEKKATERRNNILLFGGTERYKKTLTNLHALLEKVNVVSYDEYRDEICSNISNEDFLALHDYVFEVEEISETIEGGFFPMKFVFHDGICFEIIYGQGCIISARKPMVINGT